LNTFIPQMLFHVPFQELRLLAMLKVTESSGRKGFNGAVLCLHATLLPFRCFPIVDVSTNGSGCRFMGDQDIQHHTQCKDQSTAILFSKRANRSRASCSQDEGVQMFLFDPLREHVACQGSRQNRAILSSCSSSQFFFSFST